MKPQHLLASLAAAAIAAAWMAWPAPLPAPLPLPAPEPLAAAAPPAAPHAAAPARAWLSELPAPADAAAWESMAAARVHGDPRTPPLLVQRDSRSAPTPSQLADPAAYRQFEQSRHAQVLDAFAAAAETELPRLQADVERARLAGIPADQIARVEKKIRRLESMRRAIVDTGQVPP